MTKHERPDHHLESVELDPFVVGQNFITRRLTRAHHAAIDGAVKRLQLARVRICQRCGRGRAELEAADGASITIPLDPVRADELERQGEADDVPWLSSVVLALFRSSGAAVREVVLDADTHGLRALVSISRGEDTDVVGCTPQEGVSLAVRGPIPLYATDDALATEDGTPDREGHDRLH